MILFLTLFALHTSVVRSISGCDDLDVAFVLSAQAFPYSNGQGSLDISDVVNQVLRRGSSEDDGFSVVLYGEMPAELDPVLVTFEETQPEHSRKTEVEMATTVMQEAQAAISGSAADSLKTVPLIEAFMQAVNETKPDRAFVKAQLLSGVDYTTDLDDDATRYIIYDFFNELITGNIVSPDFCALLEWESQHENQSVHFIFGQQIDDPETLTFDCGDVAIPDDLFTGKMMGFDDDDDFGDETVLAQFMESVYRWTCPAYAQTDQGLINVGNHVQWMDLDSIVECSLINIYENNVSLPIELSDDSYVLVKDVSSSLNSYELDDYLMAYPAIEGELEARGCWLPVLHIIGIEASGNACDTDEADCTMLRLTVRKPDSPDEYIDIDTDVLLTVPTSRRRRMGGVTSGVSIDLDQSNEWEWTFTNGGLTYSLLKGGPLEVSGTGNLGLAVNTRVQLSVYVGGSLKIDVSQDGHWYEVWKLSVRTQARFELSTDYHLTAGFMAEISGQLAIEFELFEHSTSVIWWIGPVPVLIEKYFKLALALTTVPQRIAVGFECQYGQTLEFGAEYDSEGGSNDFYSGATDHSDNGCVPRLEIPDSEDNNALDASTCMNLTQGFDAEIRTYIGAKIYEVVEPYLKLAFILPVRVYMPEFNENVCAGASTSCDDHLMASLSIGFRINLYIGGTLGDWSAEQLISENIIVDDVRGEILGDANHDWSCTTLDGGAQFFDDFLRVLGCCHQEEIVGCFPQGPCDSGYMDVSNGTAEFWMGGYCGGGAESVCTGGFDYMYLGLYGECKCGCQPAGSCQSLSGYANFNVYRYVPLMRFIRYFGATGDYVAVVLVAVMVTCLVWICCRCCKCKTAVAYSGLKDYDSEATVEDGNESEMEKL